MMLPPRPPLPPSGPPNSTNLSRWKEIAPFPPSPERIYTFASSRNFISIIPAQAGIHLNKIKSMSYIKYRTPGQAPRITSRPRQMPEHILEIRLVRRDVAHGKPGALDMREVILQRIPARAVLNHQPAFAVDRRGQFAKRGGQFFQRVF